jgi:hypothetical protein
MDWQVLSSDDWSLFINWLTNDVHNSTKGSWSNWHHDGVSSIIDLLSSDETLSRIQSDGSNVVSTQMLGDLENESVLNSLDFKGIENWGKVSFELHVNDGTDNLGNSTNTGDFLCEVSYVIDVRNMNSS